MPQIRPEGSGLPVAKGNLINEAEGLKARNNVFPDWSIEVVTIT
jgi:hypothetical protein